MQLFVLPRSRHPAPPRSTLQHAGHEHADAVEPHLKHGTARVIKKTITENTTQELFSWRSRSPTVGGSVCHQESHAKKCVSTFFTWFSTVCVKNNTFTSLIQRCLLKPSPERASLAAPSDRPPDNSVLVTDPTLPSSGHYSYSRGGGAELFSNYSYSRARGTELFSNSGYSWGRGTERP